MSRLKYQAIVIGASAGGIESFGALLKKIHSHVDIPVLVVQHIKKGGCSDLGGMFSASTGLKVAEAELNEPILPGKIYIAPSDFHMVVEQDKTITLLSTEPVNYSRPSIDVLFETAAEVYGKGLIGIILSGASADGSKGLKKVSEFGGCTVVQCLNEADFKIMPYEALNLVKADFVGKIDEIGDFLIDKMEELV